MFWRRDLDPKERMIVEYTEDTAQWARFQKSEGETYFDDAVAIFLGRFLGILSNKKKGVQTAKDKLDVLTHFDSVKCFQAIKCSLAAWIIESCQFYSYKWTMTNVLETLPACRNWSNRRL